MVFNVDASNLCIQVSHDDDDVLLLNTTKGGVEGVVEVVFGIF